MENAQLGAWCTVTKNGGCCCDGGLVDNPCGGLSGNREVTGRLERRCGVAAPGTGGSPSLEGPGESVRFMGSELRATVNKAFHGGGGVPPKQGMGRTPWIGRARGPSRHLHTHHLPSSLSKPSILSCFPCKKAEVHESDWLKLQSDGWVLGLLGAS